MAELTVTAPFDLSKLKTLSLHTHEQAMAKVALLHDTFEEVSTHLSIADRKAILKRFQQLLQDQKESIAKASAREGGKPLQDSNVEVERAIGGVEVAIETMGHLTGTEIPMNLGPSSMGRMAYTYKTPVGLVLAISAFNHPVNLIIHQVVPAIAVGCPVLVKPASSTPLICFRLIDLLYEAGLPEAWCQAVVCDNTVSEALVKDPRVRFLSFIGSARVGWHLRSVLPPGAECALEHGGAAPVIVEPDADLKDALPLLVKGGFYHAGQVCVSVQRVYAHKTIARPLAEQIALSAQQLVIGDPTLPETDVGPLIDPREVDRIDEWVNEAIEQGATLLCGGKKQSDTCYRPTVLFNPPDDVRVSTKEIFGPVVCVYEYDHYLDAIERANALPFCFQASVFTQNINRAMKIMKALKGTAIMINDHTAFRVDWMPFGGREHSGASMGGIPYSMDDLLQEKMFVIRYQEIV